MDSKILFIGEVGVNHNGKLELAKQLVDLAAVNNLDIVKFQTYKTELLTEQHATLAPYQRKTVSNTQYEMLKKYELSEKDFIELKAYSEGKGIEFLSSAFDIESLYFLHNLGQKRFKIPSGELTNYPLLKEISTFGKPVIMSTGMSTIKEIEDSMKVITADSVSTDMITLLHCTTAYPAEFSKANLRSIATLKEKFSTKVGLSDHTKGYEAMICAISLGAEVIEKHITLDKSMSGPDHLASLDPKELDIFSTKINETIQGLGDGVKVPTKEEVENIIPARKSIFAKVEISKGETFSEENLITLRPGDGASPMMWDAIIGKKSDRDYQPYEKIVL